MLKIAHLSDLHFHESGDSITGHHRHSLPCLKAIEAVFEKEIPDHVVISGDITNIGDPINLERAYQWIHDKIYTTGEYYGLQCSLKNVGVLPVPGNHDAFNASKSGSEYKRWQSSLDNYYSAFQEYRSSSEHPGVGYKWIQKGDTRLFFCLLDSSYLGDPELDPSINRVNVFNMVAKGKISRSQSESMLRLYDKGIGGQLLDQNGLTIVPGDFMSALKIIVMHHYLFEPSDARAKPLLHMHDKSVAFQNIAMSDFDVLLCGHRHIADVHVMPYSDHFDPRGKIRLAFNHVRRSLGISSLPLRADSDGEIQNKFLRFIIGLLIMSEAKGGPLSEANVEQILNILEESLSNPSILRNQLLQYLNQRAEIRDGYLFDKQEVIELYLKMKERFSSDQRRDIKLAAEKLRSAISHLAGRPFAQIMSASAAKSSEIGTRHRAFNIYNFSNHSDEKSYRLNFRRFSWQDESQKFVMSVQNEILFPYARNLE